MIISKKMIMVLGILAVVCCCSSLLISDDDVEAVDYYSVSVNLDGGSWVGSDYITGSYAYGTNITLPTASQITKSGYYLSVIEITYPTYTVSQLPGTNLTVTDNISLKMRYDELYSVSINLNGGSWVGSDYITGEYPRNTSLTLPTTSQIVKTGYTFNNLSVYYHTSGLTVYNPSGGNLTVTEPITISISWIAVYDYRLVYNTNGGSNGPSDQTYTGIGTSYTFTISSTTPTYPNYRFLGWADSASATVPDYVAGDTITLTTSSLTKTIYAVWEWYSSYTLIYDDNGGSNGPGASTYGPTTDQSWDFTVSGIEPTYAYYAFLGWADSASATEAQYEYGDTITLTSDGPTKTIYAVWEITIYNYSLTYDANGGSGAPGANEQSTTSPSYLFVISSVIPTRTNYDFLGWADSASSLVAQYAAGDTITLTATNTTKTIYAVWVAQGSSTFTYTLTYNGNGGSGVPVTQAATGTSLSYTFTIPDVKPVKSGYVFVGWSLSPSATAASYSPGSTFNVSANTTTTLYAVWNEDGGFSFSFDYLIKQISQSFFGGSTTIAGLVMIIIAWLIILAVLANIGASPAYSVVPMIPMVIIFSAMGIINAEITILVIIVSAVLCAGTVRDLITR